MPTLTFEEAYRYWRNKARRYSSISLLSKCFNALGSSRLGDADSMRHAPWQITLMVKWICQDHRMHSAREVTDDEFLSLRQTLWDIQNRIDLNCGGSLPGYLLFRQLTNSQLGFQRRISRGFVRDAAMLHLMDDNNKVKRHFEDSTGLSPREFIDLAYITLALCESSESRILSARSYKDLCVAFGEDKVNAFLKLVSADLDELIGYCSALFDARKRVTSEYFEFPPIKRFPLFRTPDGFLVWHKAILYRSLESLAHIVLSSDPHIFNRFTKVFEHHVVAEARRFPGEFFDENQLKQWLPKGSNVPEGLIAFHDANVFIESKAGVFDEQIMTVGNAEIFRDRTWNLTKAIQQGVSASQGLRDNQSLPPRIREQKADYLIVVTNRELALGNGARFMSMHAPKNRFDFGECSTLPATHVYFVHIDDFERLVSNCVDRGLHLPSILAQCVEADAHADSSVFFFSQHLDRLGFSRSMSALVTNAHADVFDRLTLIAPNQDSVAEMN